jgi:hypothetical protein
MHQWSFLLVAAAPAVAQTELQQLNGPMLREEAAFGWSVAAHGGWLAVGAPDASGSGLGKVHVYREDRGAWEHYQALYPTTLRRDCYTSRVPFSLDLCRELSFGFTLSMGEDRLLVGSPGTYRGALPDRHGGAYLYQYDPLLGRWMEEAELGQLATPSPGVTDSFGWTVAIDGDVAVVGAPDRNLNTGCAYVFERTTGGWAQTAFLEGETPGPDHYFGWAVAADGNRIAISEVREFDAGYRAGAVYMYRRAFTGDWELEDKLLPDPQFVHSPVTVYFGSSIDLSSGILVVGAIFYGDISPTIAQDNPGAAYVYRLDWGGGSPSWTFQQALGASDGARENEFGGKVSIAGNRIVVCAAQYDVNEVNDENSGSAYVFGWDGSSWIEESILRPMDLHPQQFFGNSLASEGSLVVVGSSQDDLGGIPNSGTVHLFSLLP